MRPHPDRLLRPFVLGLGLLPALLISCGGGGGGGGGSANSAQADVLLTGVTSSDELCSLSVAVTEVTLVDDGGRETGNLLRSPAEIDLLALSGQHALLALAPAPSGRYVEVRAAIDPTSVHARDVYGNPVDIAVTHPSASASPSHPIVLPSGGVAPIGIEVPVLDCLSDRRSGRELQLVIGIPDLPRDVVLDLVFGRVTREVPEQDRFSMEALRGDAETPIGPITVLLDSQTVLLDDDGHELATIAEFFDALEVGDVVEVHGQLRPDGTLAADAVEIEDRHGRPVAQIEGTVLRLDLDRNLLEARIDHIKSGAGHVHDAIGDAPTFTVTWDSSTVFVHHEGRRDDHGHHRDDDDGGDGKDHGHHDDHGGGGDHGDDRGHGSASEQDLAIGERLEMKFLDFVSAPFLAHKIQIEDRAEEFDATIHEVTDLPRSFLVHLAPYDPAVIAGLVASSETDVRVTLANLRSTFLDVCGEPELDVSRLLVGLRVRLGGTLAGDPTAPTIDAAMIRVEPGELFGTLQSLDGGTHSGIIDVTRIDEPFGGPPLPDPLPFVLARGARFTGAAESERELIDLFLGLESGERIAVRVLGLNDPDAGAVKLYDVRSDVERGR